jgi:hypothetical protein
MYYTDYLPFGQHGGRKTALSLAAVDRGCALIYLYPVAVRMSGQQEEGWVRIKTEMLDERVEIRSVARLAKEFSEATNVICC